jgi:hypothetical protein
MRTALRSIGSAVVVLALVVQPTSGQEPARTPAPTECPAAPARQFAPALEGAPLPDAQATAAQLGYTLSIAEQESDAEPGTVLSQDPLPGREIQTGDAISVSVAVPLAATPQPTATPAPEANAGPDLASLSLAQLKRRAKKVPYRRLFRNSERFVGDLVYFRGEVIQVLGSPEEGYDLRVNVTKDGFGFWKDTVYLMYDGPRLLEDDIIEFAGLSAGVVTYESILGGEISIPGIVVLKARVLN